MKIAVFGFDFPIGKKNLSDPRLDELNKMFHPPKFTCIKIEFQDRSHLKDAQAILCDSGAKLDLILQDLDIVEQRIAQEDQQKELFLRLKEALEKETLISEVTLSQEEKSCLLNFNLITLKPVTFVNSKDPLNEPEMIKKVYEHSGRISFFTVNERELRAWSIPQGATAHEAAGLIHSDIQKGFIKAEVVGYEDLIKAGGLNQAKAAGLLKLEDKDYPVKDADLIKFRFSR